jgi:dimethylamine/trimethylamine dehydrogenase
VTLCEATRELGGRVVKESALPGLAEWARVRDYRATMLEKHPRVEVFRESRLDAPDVMEFGAEHVLIATGSHWRRDGVGRHHRVPIPAEPAARIFTPDDLMAGDLPRGRALIFDDDNYYLGGVLAELLRRADVEVTLVTTEGEVSSWTHNTMEQHRIQARLIDLGVVIRPHRALVEIRDGSVGLACVYTDRVESVECDAVVLVTSRIPEDRLYHDLAASPASKTLQTLRRIGDCLAPSTIAQAVWDGHRAARELEGPAGDDAPFRWERTQLEPRRPNA